MECHKIIFEKNHLLHIKADFNVSDCLSSYGYLAQWYLHAVKLRIDV